MISLARYAELLRTKELRSSMIASIIGRLPIGITGLAVLLLVQASSGSFASAGAAAGRYVGGLAALAPAVGRLIDRYGPRWLLLGCGLAFPATLVALTIAVSNGGPLWAVLVLAACAGACFPPITVSMRTYLKRVLGDETQLVAAYSLESVLIEVIFLAGPMLVAVFVAFLSPAAAVLFAAGCALVGTLLFLRAPALRNWRVAKRTRPGPFGPLVEPGFLRLIGVILLYSTAFGLMEIGVTAYASEAGNPALAGLLLGLMSAGSALGGLAYGSRSWHLPLVEQFAMTLALMGAGLMLLAIPWSPWGFAVCAVFAGIVMAPALTMQAMLVAKTARAEHSTEAFTWSTSALLSGVGIGLAAGGVLLESFRSSAALAAAAGTAMLAAILAYASLSARAR